MKIDLMMGCGRQGSARGRRHPKIARMTVPEDETAGAILALRSQREKHFHLGRRIMEASRGAFCGFDILAIASLNRSVSRAPLFGAQLALKLLWSGDG